MENLKLMTNDNTKKDYTWTDITIGGIQVGGTLLAAYGMWCGANKVMTYNQNKVYSMNGLPVDKVFGTQVFDGLKGYFQRGNINNDERADIIATLTGKIVDFGEGKGLSDVNEAYLHCVNKIADFKIDHIWSSMKSDISSTIPESLVEAVNSNEKGAALFAAYIKDLPFIDNMAQYAEGVFALQKLAASKVTEGYTEMAGSVVVGGVSVMFPNIYNNTVEYMYEDSE